MNTLSLWIYVLIMKNGFHSCGNWDVGLIASFLLGDRSFLIAFYNLTANVLLFVQFVIYAIFGAPIIIIIFIEVAQFLTKRGSMVVDDLILNALGVYLGYALAPLIKKMFIPI